MRRLLATSVATLVLGTLGAVGLGSASAGAATTTSFGTTVPFASCDRYYHTLTMGGLVMLGDRFPGGAYVETRYAYWQVDPGTRQRTSAIAYTPWTTSIAQAGTIYQPFTVLGGAETVGQWTYLPSTTVTGITGRVYTSMQVAVWTGYAWTQMGDWENVTSYVDNYRGQSYGINTSVCAPSV